MAKEKARALLKSLSAQVRASSLLDALAWAARSPVVGQVLMGLSDAIQGD